MDGVMKRHELMQKLFGFQSDEEEANSNDELHEQANFVSDGGQEPESEGKTISKREEEADKRGAPEGVHRDHLQSSSRSPDNEKGKDPAALSAAVIHEVFGDSDDDKSVENIVRQTNEKRRSPKYKGNYAEESRAENVIPDEDETYKYKEKSTKPKLKGKGVALVEVFEIPLRAPPVHPNQMATIKLSNLIGIDPKPFDPATYVDEEIYVIDSSGSKRCVPSANVIRFREVRNPDGTTSVESNARFVEWEDGSLQLLIGNEAFNVSEQDAREIQSHLFLRHGKGIYQSQGRISRNMKFMPSSLSSNSHRSLTALVNSRHNKVNKVRRYISDVDPESMMEKNEKAEIQATKASQQLNKKKKKVINKYKTRDYKERQLTPGFLEDNDNEDNEQNDFVPPSASTFHHSGPDLKLEADVEKRIMNAKMMPKDTHKSTTSSVELTMGQLDISKGKAEEMREDENELYDESEGSEGESKKSGSNLKKQIIESDEDMPQRKTNARRHCAIMYDSSDE